MRTFAHISELVGGTPLVMLGPTAAGLAATILVKVEYLNPGGSIKDRIAKRIIDQAEQQGKLVPGGTIVEPTSGNTGVGLALLASQRGYRCIFVCPDKVSEDKRDVLSAYGAEVVVTPTDVSPEDPRSYYSVSARLAAQTPGGFMPNQYANQAGPDSHYLSTGPEIWADTDGQVTHLVAGVGTGGTITGTGRFLKEISGANPQPVQIVGVDPVGSIYSNQDVHQYQIEGVGEDFWPQTFDPSIPDEILTVGDEEAFRTARKLAREESLFLGGSSGMAVAGALRLAERLQREDLDRARRAVIVVIAPDGGRGYTSKFYNDQWLAAQGFTSAL